MRQSTTRGAVLLNASLGVVTASALVWGGVLALQQGTPSSTTRAFASNASTLQFLAASAGLEPEALAAAGVAPTQLQGLFEAISAHHRENSDALARAERALDHSRHSGNPESRGAAESARAAALAAYAQAGESVLTPDQRGAIAVLRSNKEQRVPAEFRVVARSPQDWKRLRDALTSEGIARREGVEVEAAARLFLAEARANTSVAQAAGRLAASAASMKSAWADAARQAATAR
jgi:hypothetical protein